MTSKMSVLLQKLRVQFPQASVSFSFARHSGISCLKVLTKNLTLGLRVVLPCTEWRAAGAQRLGYGSERWNQGNPTGQARPLSVRPSLWLVGSASTTGCQAGAQSKQESPSGLKRNKTRYTSSVVESELLTSSCKDIFGLEGWVQYRVIG